MPGFFRSIADLFKRGTGSTKRADYSALYEGHQEASGSVYPREPRTAAESNERQLHGSERKNRHKIFGSLKRKKVVRGLQADDGLRDAVREEPDIIVVERDHVPPSSSRLAAGEAKDDVMNKRKAVLATGKPPRPPKSSARPSMAFKKKVPQYPAPNITVVREEYPQSDDLEGATSAADDPSFLKPPPRRLKKRPRIWRKPVPSPIPQSVVQVMSPLNAKLPPLEETDEDTGELPNGVEIPSFPSVKVGEGMWDIDHQPQTEALKDEVEPLEGVFDESFEDQTSYTEPTETGNTEGDTTALTDLFPTPLSNQASLTDAECHSLPPREVFIYDDSKCDGDDEQSLKGLFHGADAHSELLPKECGCSVGTPYRQDTVYSTEESVVVPVTAMQLQLDMAQVRYVPALTPTDGPQDPMDELMDVDYPDDEEPVLEIGGPPPVAREMDNMPLPEPALAAGSDDVQVLQCTFCGLTEAVHNCMYSDEVGGTFLGGNHPAANVPSPPTGSPSSVALSDLDVSSSELPPLSSSIGPIPAAASTSSLPGMAYEDTARSGDGDTRGSAEPRQDMLPLPELEDKSGWIYHELSMGIRVELPSTIPLEERSAWAEGKLRIQSAAASILEGNRTMASWDNLLEAFETPPFDWIHNSPDRSELELDLVLKYEKTIIGIAVVVLLEIQQRRRDGVTPLAASGGLWSPFEQYFEELGWTEEKPRRLRDLMHAVELELPQPACANEDADAMDVDPSPEPHADPWQQYPAVDDDARIDLFMTQIKMPVLPDYPDLIPDAIRDILNCTRRLMLEERTTPLWNDLLTSFQGLRWLDDPPDPKMRDRAHSSVSQFEIDLIGILVFSGAQFGLVLDLIVSVSRHAHLGEVYSDLVEKMEALGWNPSTPKVFRDLMARKRILEPVDPQHPPQPGIDDECIRIPGCSMTFTVAAAHTGDQFVPTAIQVTADSTIEQFRASFGGQFGPEVWDALTMDLILKYLAQLMKRDYPYPEYLRASPACRLLGLAARGLVTMEDLARGWLRDPERENRFEDVVTTVDAEDGGEGKDLVRRSTLLPSCAPNHPATKHPMTRGQNAKKRNRDGLTK